MLAARRFPLILIFCVLLVALYFSYQATREIFTYTSLQAQAPVRILQWEVEEIQEKFALKALYSFEAGGETWKGSSRLLKPYYWNEPAAVSALKRRAKEEWTVWYQPQNPGISALEKQFPTSLFIRTCVCYLVLIYLFSLKRKIYSVVNS